RVGFLGSSNAKRASHRISGTTACISRAIAWPSGPSRRRLERRVSRALVALARRWQDAMRLVSTRLQVARGSARCLFRAPAYRPSDGAHDLRPLVGFLRRSDRKKTAEPFLSRVERAVIRH